MRWGIETSFRELKYAVGLTSFHSKKSEYITQEIWARLILYNFCEIITAHVTITKCTNRHVYQINYTFAIHICKYFISKMAEKSPPDVEALISKEILPVRPGRHDPRKVDHKKAVSFLYIKYNIQLFEADENICFIVLLKKSIVPQKRITLSLFLIKTEIG